MMLYTNDTFNDYIIDIWPKHVHVNSYFLQGFGQVFEWPLEVWVLKRVNASVLFVQCVVGEMAKSILKVICVELTSESN
jgi:hypothetical protein